MHAYKVAVVVVIDDAQNIENVDIEAAYYVAEDEFMTFKDADHKQIASFNVRNVVSIMRAERKASIGSVTVNIQPELDESAMQRLVDEITSRAERARLRLS